MYISMGIACCSELAASTLFMVLICIYANLRFQFISSKFCFELRAIIYSENLLLVSRSGLCNMLTVRCEVSFVPLNITCRFLKLDVSFECKIR
jgi:hypothetical protein